MNNVANLALEGGDPRDPQHHVIVDEPVETQLLRAAHDPSVTFEEYMYWAALTRAEEKVANERYVAAAGPKTFKSILKNRFSKGHIEAVTVDAPSESGFSGSEKGSQNEKPGEPTPQANLMRVTPDEWKMASRAVRTAGWSSVFYLVTTDILGPFSVPCVGPNPSTMESLANIRSQVGLSLRWDMAQA
jgi:hypothetical protein